mmetsp:Transcript_5232/g.5362  ORF Transcript_5232/g.5362 Transcript_5232/m.5362 type:complete len:457 (+) Transcript_5232:114-1484(+)
MSSHSLGSLETASIHSSQQQQKSYFDVHTWCGDRLDSESSHLLVGGDNSTSSNSNSQQQQSEQSLDIEEILYASNAFWATLKPVALTLVLSSLAVIYIQSATTQSDNQSGLKVYDIDDDDTGGGDSNSIKMGKSFINALTIVCVLALFTFLLVFLYWMRCMKCLLGYMIFSSCLLLALMGGLVWYTALEKWQLPCDYITFFAVLYNFAIVGIISIFYQKGIPTIVTQGYLVCTSVILAWQLSRFDEWTAWALLIMLAFYDLCAVLTPCGPLKALVGLMQERNEPLPGLLYEADLPPPTHSQRTNPSGSSRERSQRVSTPAPGAVGVNISLLGMMADKEKTVSNEGGHKAVPSQAMNHSNPEEEEEVQDYSIKLGLGDFVFYSVLVSRAAKYGFATCVACFLVIVGGLGLTLVLLAVFRKALPALPISILLGVFFYLCTRFIIIPFIEAAVAMPVYM